MLCGVVSESSRPIRARNADEKQRRRDDILKAAELLWQTTPYSELSMNQVAREAHLAKGTLYLYFDTKEELFLALLANHLQEWFNDISERLRLHTPKTVDEVTDVMLMSSQNREPLRRLLLLLSTVLERNVRPESLQAFRRMMRQEVTSIASLLPYPPALSVRMMMHIYALSVGWHQSTEAKTAVTQDDAMYIMADYQRPSFEIEFNLAVRAILTSLVAQSAAEGTTEG